MIILPKTRHTMFLNVTSSLNDTQVISVRFPNISTKLEFGPAWIWIGAVAAILFVVVCMMWVISRQLRRKDADDEVPETSHKLGQPTIGANFLHPLVNDKAPGLTTGWHNYYPARAAHQTFTITENKQPLLSNSEIHSNIYKKSNV